MLFLMVLLVGYAVTWAVARRRTAGRDRWRLALAGAMVVAGVLHLVQPAPFVQHLPVWVPERELLVLLSGLAEIGLGLGLLTPPPWRRLVGTLLALFLVVVFPANVHVAVEGIDVEGQPGGIYPWLRLLFQPLFVWLALWTSRDRLGGRRSPARRDGGGSHTSADVEVVA